jgi:hypothetical protein
LALADTAQETARSIPVENDNRKSFICYLDAGIRTRFRLARQNDCRRVFHSVILALTDGNDEWAKAHFFIGRRFSSDESQ